MADGAKWIRIVTDIFDDEKIAVIESMPDADALIVIWFKLLCLSGRRCQCGVLMITETMPYTEEMLAAIFRRPLTTVRLALKTFEQFGMIEIINDAITIPNWGKYQSLDAYERGKEAARKRQQAYRKRQKQLVDGSNCDNDSCDVTGDVMSDVTGDVTSNVMNTSFRSISSSLYKDISLSNNDPSNGSSNIGSGQTVEQYVMDSVDMRFGAKQADELASYLEQLGEDVVRYATTRMLENGVQAWAYLRKMLNGYLKDGLTTLQAVEAKDKAREAAKAKRQEQQERKAPQSPPARERDFNFV